MFAHRGEDDRVGWAFTDRFGGVSGGGYAELNLGARVGDDPAAVRANRARVAAALGVAPAALAFLHQVHGSTVHVVPVGEPPAPVRPEDEPVADAVLTDAAGRVLAVLVADCSPVLLFDAAGGPLAAVHAGRRGLAAGVLAAAVGALRERGARRVRALIGPTICAAHYEVPAALHDEVAAVVPAASARTPAGTPALDIAAGLASQLRDLDVPTRRTGDCPSCDPRLFSHRRDGPATGRFAGLLWRPA